MRNKLNGYYNYTVILTYIGMLSGFCGIAFAFDEMFRLAILFLMIAGFCDMFDGAVASTRERTDNEKRFGIQIDSLSDLICFGVLPALITYCVCDKKPLALAIGCFYVLCALIRLAYFNVMEEERQAQEGGRRTSYQGLPVTTAALAIPLFFFVDSLLPQTRGLVFLGFMSLMALAFISPFRVRKPHHVGKIVMLLLGLAELAMMIFWNKIGL